ncbi:MAG: S53 family peptidase [Intrasporangium sp.]|uniref:S53 family peptidase n=1 Tax=Intrasporangium sp. TaxID=1925024 RepID=UPI0026484E28|nr:S53 family peptidase [Intrasporangium sp.]MDN5794665.1 S53 family peptidase [Intrasporangium sp.]
MPRDRIPVPGSSRALPESTRLLGRIARDEQVEVTLVLRRRADLPDPARSARLTLEELETRYGADPADVALVTDTVTRAGATVIGTDRATRRMRVSGATADLEALFGTTLTRAHVEHEGTIRQVRMRTGAINVPAELDGVLTAVLGLDTRPQAQTQFRPGMSVSPGTRASAPGTSYTPLDLARIYRMPSGTDGSAQTLAIIELGGGYRVSDLAHYFDGLATPMPQVTAVGVDGATNAPSGDPNSADGEVVLDIEVAGAIAARASLVVYFAPNTDAGFLDAVSTAARATPAPTAMSISWGQGEDQWTPQARAAMDDAFADAAALGITVTAAAGDHGSADNTAGTGVHVDFPASSPHVLACGGTSLVADPATGAVTSETVWNDGPGRGATGGGTSDTFPQPGWQDGAQAASSVHGRGVPDVAGDADPATGYRVYIDGTDAVYGGTSAVAPLWAALVCRLAQSLDRPLGLVAARLYEGVRPGMAQPGFRDITSGTNGAYHAGPGWDPCTGLGAPDGTALLDVLAAGSAT